MFRSPIKFKMGLNLGNKILNVELKISKKPNVEKLKKELSGFFDENKVLGINIKEFEIQFKEGDYSVGRIKPDLENRKFFKVGEDYGGELKEIGKKYGFVGLGFDLSCYGK
jgi:hypothetical protein